MKNQEKLKKSEKNEKIGKKNPKLNLNLHYFRNNNKVEHKKENKNRTKNLKKTDRFFMEYVLQKTSKIRI